MEVEDALDRVRNHVTEAEWLGGVALANEYYKDSWGFEGGVLEAFREFKDDPPMAKDILDGVLFYIARWDACQGQKRLSIGELRSVASK